MASSVVVRSRQHQRPRKTRLQSTAMGDGRPMRASFKPFLFLASPADPSNPYRENDKNSTRVHFVHSIHVLLPRFKPPKRSSPEPGKQTSSNDLPIGTHPHPASARSLLALAVPRYLGGQLMPRKVEPRHGFGRSAAEIQTQTILILTTIYFHSWSLHAANFSRATFTSRTNVVLNESQLKTNNNQNKGINRSSRRPCLLTSERRRTVNQVVVYVGYHLNAGDAGPWCNVALGINLPLTWSWTLPPVGRRIHLQRWRRGTPWCNGALGIDLAWTWTLCALRREGQTGTASQQSIFRESSLMAVDENIAIAQAIHTTTLEVLVPARAPALLQHDEDRRLGAVPNFLRQSCGGITGKVPIGSTLFFEAVKMMLDAALQWVFQWLLFCISEPR
ncbi:hypothetical protein B0H14DRAFT_2579639 [Mycena olivaceomarginata]|nr:hypothetical protein B0H14DRAFT_2579639 [Mycena olivaceomarginata]